MQRIRVLFRHYAMRTIGFALIALGSAAVCFFAGGLRYGGGVQQGTVYPFASPSGTDTDLLRLYLYTAIAAVMVGALFVFLSRQYFTRGQSQGARQT